MILRRWSIVALLVLVAQLSACRSGPSQETVIPLSRFILGSDDAGLETAGEELRVTTSPKRWAYAAVASLGNLPAYEGAVKITVTVRTAEGTIGIGVLNKDKSDFLVEEHVPAAAAASDIQLFVRSFEEASDLVVRNVARSGTVSVALVSEIRIGPG
jgi:hypothetical protein